MYMWLVLSTFLAILAGYSLPLRSDAPEKISVPVASAHVYKMIVKHKMALEYIRKLKWPYYCEGHTPGGGVVDECFGRNRTGFDSGEVDNADIENYAPDVFEITDDYKTHIFCYDEDGVTPSGDCKEDDAENKQRILITFGDLHERWLTFQKIVEAGGSEESEVSPNVDIMKAFNNSLGSDEYVGYVKENASTADIVNYLGVVKYTIPEDMWNTMSGSDMCNKNYNGSCIAYVSML